MENISIGLLELNSIVAGIHITDTMLKTADVKLVLARTICSGKYMIIVSGSVSAVEASVQAGLAQWEGAVIDSMVIPNVHPSIFPAISGSTIVRKTGALGVIESFSVASLIEGADAAVKAADVQLFEIRLAMALGGKAFASMTGDVSSVTEAVEVGAKVIMDKGLLVNKTVIAAPEGELFRNYI
jgi:microcompartment protein CcmL/EutN